MLVAVVGYQLYSSIKIMISKVSLVLIFFLKIIGFAKQNIKNTICDNFNTSTIKFEVRDAKKIHLPNERLAVFLFNPFGLDTMRMFLSNNIKLMHQNKSVMMYANDQFLDELLKFGTLDMRDDFFNLSVISF